MKMSAFQFSNPELDCLSFQINSEFNGEGPVNIEIGLSTSISAVEDLNEDGEQQARVSITVQIGRQDATTPFYLEATEAANFKWKKDEYNGQQVEVLLNKNAVAMLISYLRPIIAGVTSSSKYPTYNLPYLDLTSLKIEPVPTENKR